MKKPKVHIISDERTDVSDLKSVPMRHADAVVVFSGDGGILRAFREMSGRNYLHLPLIGINKGTVGFMSNDVVIPDDNEHYKLFINHVLTKGRDSNIFEHRPLLDIEVNGIKQRVLNEVTIHPVELGRLLDVEMEVNTYNDSSCVSLKGDGVVVSTSTGSTAYNLSAGGPIIMPHMKAMVVTPLNPFTMSARSIVMGERENVVLRTKGARIVVDGVEVDESSEIKVRVSEDTLNLVRISGFFDAIQEKLGWNRSIK